MARADHRRLLPLTQQKRQPFLTATPSALMSFCLERHFVVSSQLENEVALLIEVCQSL